MALCNSIVAEVNSTFELKSGAEAPNFTLPDGAGNEFTLAELAAGKRAVVIVFVCNHCPFVVHLAEAIGAYARDYADRGVQVIAINANDVENYPADAPDKMLSFAAQSGWDFPYLYDQSQQVAKAYSAACTPDFYLFDGDLKLAYAGQFDATRPGRDGSIDGADLRNATDAVLGGAAVAEPWLPSSGCNIKWKSGGEPAYFG